MHRFLSGLGIALAALAYLPSCMTDEGDDIKLPGDIDDAGDGGGGKGDDFRNTDNDPSYLDQHLTYTLSKLPKDGKLDNPVWKDRYPVVAGDEWPWAETYWPTAEGSTNTRWLGSTVKSPLEKYDAAFNNAPGCDKQPSTRCGDSAKAAWDEYFTCAGPAAKWQAKTYQGASHMYDGIDNDGDGKKDECDDNDGIAGWWGTCHAWTPASLLEPEPRHSVVYNGQKFEVSDIKALLITLYERTDAVMLGGRCNDATIEHDDTGTATDPACKDVNPGALHVVLANFLGLHDQPLIEDRTFDAEVWNQPIEGYHVSKLDKVDGARANACIGATGTTYAPNSKAKSLYEVKITVRYVYESYPSTSPRGSHNNIGTDDYHYILEVDGRGKIIGGEYCTESKNAHPDFLWSPKSVRSSNYGRNPSVDLDSVRTLLRLSREDGTSSGGSGTSYENKTATSIPDNDPTGAKVDVSVDKALTFKSVSVSVNIEHTYRGDLTLELLHDGALVKTLVHDEGGSADNIVDTFSVSGAEAGAVSKGTWSLHVVDDAAIDTGTVKSFKLTFLE